MTHEEYREFRQCKRSFIYFVQTYCQIYDGEKGMWIPFLLWPYQYRGALAFKRHRRIIIGKARQMGWTWLVLCWILWNMIFHPECRALVSSARDDDAIYLLSEERMRGIFYRLPLWLTAGLEDNRSQFSEETSRNRKNADAKRHWALTNGSNVRAFPIGRGDSYTMTIAFVDEADSADEAKQRAHDKAVRPTVDGGGQYIKLSKFYKDKSPKTPFKVQYKKARAGKIKWFAMFAGALDRPDRTREWFEEVKREAEETGTEDDRKENYPLTEEEALEPKQEGKRFAAEHIHACYSERRVKKDADLVSLAHVPNIPGLRIFIRPQPGRKYVVGADPAEGKEGSDDSALVVVDALTLRQVCVLNGPIEIGVFGDYIKQVSKFYNNASVLVERNNHGHAVLLWLRDNSYLDLLRGEDDDDGWLTTLKSKAFMFMIVAQVLYTRTAAIHDFETRTQLESIERGTLKAPPGQPDDVAVAYCLAIVGAYNVMSQPLF